jgi:microcystin degradation protein MlrC
MVNFDYMVGMKLYPHEDQWEVGHQALTLLPRLMNNNLSPKIHIEHLPMTLPTTSTDKGFAAHEMNKFVENVLERYRSEPYFASEEILDLTVYHGFPYSDVEHVGVHVVCSCTVDLTNARDAAREVAYWIWTHRLDFLPKHPSPTECVTNALRIYFVKHRKLHQMWAYLHK